MSERLMPDIEKKPVSLSQAKSLLHKAFEEQISFVSSSSESSENKSLINAAFFMIELDSVIDNLLIMSEDNHQILNLKDIGSDLQKQKHIPSSTRSAILTYAEHFLKENEKTKKFAQRYNTRDLYKIITGGRNLRTIVDQSVYGTALLWQFHSDFPMKPFFEAIYKDQLGYMQGETLGNIHDHTINGQKIRIIAVPKGAKEALIHEKNHEKYDFFICPADKNLTLDEKLEKGIIQTADEFTTQIYSYWLDNLKAEIVALFSTGMTLTVRMRLPGQPSANHEETHVVDFSPQIVSYNFPEEDKEETKQLYVQYFGNTEQIAFEGSYQRITDQYKEFKRTIVSSLCDLFKGYTQKETESRNSGWIRPYTVFTEPGSEKSLKTIFSLFILYPVEQWAELIDRCQRSFLVYHAEKNIQFMPWRLEDDLSYDENDPSYLSGMR